jgi:hypothetical protein
VKYHVMGPRFFVGRVAPGILKSRCCCQPLVWMRQRRPSSRLAPSLQQTSVILARCVLQLVQPSLPHRAVKVDTAHVVWSGFENMSKGPVRSCGLTYYSIPSRVDPSAHLNLRPRVNTLELQIGLTRRSTMRDRGIGPSVQQGCAL